MIETLKQKNYYYKLILLIAAIIWGSSFVVFKTALDELPPALIITFRFIIAAIGLFFICRKKFHLMNGRVFFSGIIIGTAMAFSYYFQNLGLKTTMPGKNAFLTSVYTILVPFMYWVLAKRRPDMYNVIAAILCVAGIGLVSLGDAKGLVGGDFLTLFSAVFIALQIVLAAKLLKGGDIYLITFVQFLTGAAINLILHFIFEPPAHFYAVSAGTILQVVYLGVFATLVSLLFQNIGQRHMPPAQASIILSLEAVFGVIFSVIFFGERLTFLSFIGFAAIFISVLISETKPRFVFNRR